MRATSLRDIMLADSLKHIKSEVLLISPSNDSLVADVLEQIGYDIKQPWEYVPSKHRCMGNKISVGFMVVGEYSRDPKYRHFLDTTDRVIVAGMFDAGLARDMSTLMGRKNIYRNDEDKWEDGARARKDDVRYYSDSELLALGFTGDSEDPDEFEGEYLERDWEETLRAIKVLEETRDLIRGV